MTKTYKNALGQEIPWQDNWFNREKIPWELYPPANNPFVSIVRGRDGTKREFRWWIDECPELDSGAMDECPGFVIEHMGPLGEATRAVSCPFHAHRWVVDHMSAIERKEDVDRRMKAANIPRRYDTYSLYNYPRRGEEWAEVCMEYASAGRLTQNIILAGSFGTGKTSLAVSILSERVRVRGEHGYFCVVPALFEEIRASFSSPESSTLMQRAMNVGLLVLDDLGAERATEWVQAQLYTLINHRLIHEKPTIVTTNLTLTQLGEKLGERTIERLKAYRLVVVGGRNLRDVDAA